MTASSDRAPDNLWDRDSLPHGDDKAIMVQAMFDQSGGSTNCWFGFDIRFGDDGSEWALGEDVSFCLRAGEQGHKVYVDTTAHVGHHKGGRVYWPEDTKTMGVRPPEEPKLTDDNART